VKTAADNGWDAQGIDLSEDTSALADNATASTLSAHGSRKATFEPESFDAITLWDVIEHVPDPPSTRCSA
jgi:2-polyprenyl-3-methyl-5-hydroxy-6-metoxy-1,4-benzoquinol methylase